MIELRDVSVAGGPKPRLRGVSLVLDAAQPLVVVGRSGAGKTTLLRVLLGLAGQHGEVVLGGRPAAQLSRRERARWLAWLPQQAAPVEPLEARDYLLGARFAWDESREASLKRIEAALEACGVGHLARRPVTQVSGGEFQRIAMAGLLAQDARFLLLDEPANHLDPALRRTLYDLLAAELAGGRGLLAVTHEIDLITALSHRLGRPVRVVGLAEGRVAFDCASDAGDLDRHLGELYGLPHRAVHIEGRRYFLAGLDPA